MVEHTDDDKTAFLDEQVHVFMLAYVVVKKLGRVNQNSKDVDAFRFVDEQVQLQFSSVATNLHSIGRITFPCCDREIKWDATGVAALARSIMDAALGIAYAREPCTEPELAVKHAVFNLHSLVRKQRISALTEVPQDQLEQDLQYLEQFRKRIQDSPLFQGPLAKLRKIALKGGVARLYTEAEICRRAGIDPSTFSIGWITLSTLLHSHPQGIVFLGDAKRDEKRRRVLIGISLRYAACFAGWAANEYSLHFPESRAKLSADEIGFLGEIVEGLKSGTTSQDELP